MNCLDSDGTEKPVSPNVINSEILFGPKGSVSQLDHNNWKQIQFILQLDDVVDDTPNIKRKKVIHFTKEENRQETDNDRDSNNGNIGIQ